MSSTLHISKDEPGAWMPSVDIFANILQKISDELYPHHETLRQKIDEALVGFPFLGISEDYVDQATFNDFVDAVCRVVENEIAGDTYLAAL